VGGVWVPYFRHHPDHGYLVADSTRYMMFPSFRGVRAVEIVEIDIGGNKDGGDGESGAVKEKAKRASTADENDSAKLKEEEDTGEQMKESANDDSMDVDEVAKDGERDSAGKSKIDTSKDAMDVDSNVEADGEATKDSSDDDRASEATTTEASNKKASRSSKEGIKAEEKEAGAQSTTSTTKNKPQRYRVIDNDSKNAWTAEEDLRLLDAIITCGLGNWPDIAEHVNGGTSGESGGGTGPSSSSGDANGGGNNNGGGGAVMGGGKTDKRCMERYLDDFMGRYGHILPPYTMVPDGIKEEDSEDTKPAAAPSESSDGEGGVAARKRPRRSLAASSSSIVEDDSSAPGFKKIKFRVVPTEQLDEFRGLWDHPYVPPDTGVNMGDEVGRDLWYRSEQSYIRQTTAATCSKVDAEAIRKEFIERRSHKLAGYEAKVLPPRLDDMKQLPGAELAGYMPRRGDLDMEWDNEAEQTISEMEFSAEDTKADRDLKLDVIRIFNAKLDEREKRKQFIIDQKLLHYRENQEKMWRLPPDERHLVQRMRLFARFHTQQEHETFVKKVLEAKRLRKEIAKLQLYRRLGITSLADAERYEIDKARREMHRTAWTKKDEERKKAEEEAVRAAKETCLVGVVGATAASASAISAASPAAPVGVPASGGGGGRMEGGMGMMVGAAANQSLQVWKQFKRFNKKENSSEKKKEDATSDRDKDVSSSSSAAKFTIKDKPGYELLSKKEVGLCKRLRLLPRNYLDVKKALISESLAQGILSNPSSSSAGGGGGQKNSRSIFKIDVRQRDNIIDFVLEAGWIPTRPNIC